MNLGLAEGLQDTSDFDVDSQSDPVRDRHAVAAQLLRELGAGRESPGALPCPVPRAAGRAMDRVLPEALHPWSVLLGLCWMSCAQLQWPSRSWEHLGCGRVSGHGPDKGQDGAICGSWGGIWAARSSRVCVCACVSKARGAACKNTPREKVSTEIRLKQNVTKHREHPVCYSTLLA